MSWRDLAFLHWKVAPEVLAPGLPPGVALDLHGGSAWLSLVAFRMEGVALRGGLALPGARAFAELNLRTYVRVAGTPCIHFLSLDAGSRAMVELLRRWYRLPYLAARAAAGRSGGAHRYIFERTDARAPAARLDLEARPEGPTAHATPGSLDHFLAERYAFAVADRRGRLRLGHVRHAPYPLQATRMRVQGNTFLSAWPGLDPLHPDRMAFSPGVDVAAWTLEATPDSPTPPNR
jgi:uncharacterized protein